MEIEAGGHLEAAGRELELLIRVRRDESDGIYWSTMQAATAREAHMLARIRYLQEQLAGDHRHAWRAAYHLRDALRMVYDARA